MVGPPTRPSSMRVTRFFSLQTTGKLDAGTSLAVMTKERDSHIAAIKTLEKQQV